MQHFAEVQLTNTEQKKCGPDGKDGKSRRKRSTITSVGDEDISLRDSVISMDKTAEIGRQRLSDPEDSPVPTLNNNDSKAMVERMSQVYKPFEIEDIHFPSHQEAWDFTKGVAPILSWIPETTWSSFKADIVAGLTVLVMVVPQSMSYADIAGMPYVYGLYATILPSIIYAFTGSSRQLAVGPTALVSILTSAALEGQLTEEECPAYYDGTGGGSNQSELCPEAYARLAILTAFLVGIVQVGASMAQLGFIVSFLGHPVISGFTSAAAFLIGLTQVKNVFGFKISKSQYIYVTLADVISNIHKTNYVTAVLGISFVCILIAFKKIARAYKKFAFLRPLGPLIICVLASALVYTAQLDSTRDVEVVGDVPGGLPPVSTDYTLSDISRIIGPSITIIIISYMESVAISKSLAAQHGYEVFAGQEMFALGIANLFGSMLSSFPITGSFSRSAVNNAVGATTQLAGLVTGIGVVITLAFLTPIFAYLPKFALGAIVVSSVVNLVAYDDAIHLWKVKKSDCALWFIAFFGTLFLGILWGIVTAAIISLVIVIYESVRPQVSLIWKVKGTNYYRSVKQSPNGEWVQGVLIVRFGASMYFANMSYIRDTIHGLMIEAQKDIQYVILEMSPVISIDTSAVHILEDTHKEFKKRKIQLCFANTGNRVEKVFDRAGFYTHIGGKEWFHSSTSSAVRQCLKHRELQKKDSPVKIIVKEWKGEIKAADP